MNVTNRFFIAQNWNQKGVKGRGIWKENKKKIISPHYPKPFDDKKDLNNGNFLKNIPKKKKRKGSGHLNCPKFFFFAFLLLTSRRFLRSQPNRWPIRPSTIILAGEKKFLMQGKKKLTRERVCMCFPPLLTQIYRMRSSKNIYTAHTNIKKKKNRLHTRNRVYFILFFFFGVCDSKKYRHIALVIYLRVMGREM